MKGQGGSVLLLALVVIFLGSGLAAVLFLEVLGGWILARDIEAQLYSQNLAQNGIEYGLWLLPRLEVGELLPGADRRMAPPTPGWRNPVTVEQARILEPGERTLKFDDGIPAGFPPFLSAVGRGRTLIRFSNNPEEPRGADRDDIVLVRSMGLVPALPGGMPFSFEQKNHWSLAEARLRRERAFEAQAPLMLVGGAVTVRLEEARGEIASEQGPAVVCLDPAPSTRAVESLMARLELLRPGPLVGRGTVVQDWTARYREHPRYSRLFSADFWRHFLEALPDFAPPLGPPVASLRFCRVSGERELHGPFRGVLVSRGSLAMVDCDFAGLLLHLGNGQLRMAGATRVRGAVWVADLSWAGVEAAAGIGLTLEDEAEIRFDPEAVEEALTLFPATLLGWRFIFPEMEAASR